MKRNITAFVAATALLLLTGVATAAAAPSIAQAPAITHAATVVPDIAPASTTARLNASAPVTTQATSSMPAFAVTAVTPANPSLHWCYIHKVVLKLGSRGGCVKAVQRYMNYFGINWHAKKLKVDGHYGASTYYDVKLGQRFFGLHADGVTGRATLYAFAYIRE